MRVFFCHRDALILLYENQTVTYDWHDMKFSSNWIKNIWQNLLNWSGWRSIQKIKTSGWFKKEELLKLPSPVEIDDPDLPKQYQRHPSEDYMHLKMRFRDIGRMNGIIEALGRDFLTAMPQGAYKSRLGQIAFLSRRMHEDLAAQDVADAIEKAHSHEKKNKKDWDEWDSANLFEMENMYRHHCRIDPDLMEKRAHLMYEGRVRHRDILLNNDWDSAKTFLQEMIDLQRSMAEAKCLKIIIIKRMRFIRQCYVNIFQAPVWMILMRYLDH